jgi:hypothetical protein
MFVCMFVCRNRVFLFLQVEFQAEAVNRNDTKLICSCFIKAINTTVSDRNIIRKIYGITWQNVQENNHMIPVKHTCLMSRSNN